MKSKYLLVIALLAMLFGPSQGEAMSDWKVIVPEATTNLISHPSVEAVDISGFVDINGAVQARSDTQSKWELYSLSITPHAANAGSGVHYTITGIATTTYTFSVWVYGELDAAYRLQLIDGLSAVLGLQTFTGAGTWQLVEVTGTTAANITVRCFLTKDSAGGATFYADGWQLEAKAYRTTYCDGDQEGCEWLGAKHASTSQRAALSRAGGRARDLETIYGLDVDSILGTGMAQQDLNVDEFAILPGGSMSSIKIHPRNFTLTGAIHGSSTTDLHAKRQALIALFDPEAYPGRQPVRLRYTGATIEKEIAVHYKGGLEASILATEPLYREKVALQLVAPSPFWHEVGEHSQLLDSSDSATFRYVAGRLRSTGQWDELGPPAVPTHCNFIYALAEDDIYYYVGGDFTDWNGNGDADYITRYHKQTGVWSPLGVGMDDWVSALVIGPDGNLYVGGTFTTAGGGAAFRVAMWNTTTEVWSALGTGLDDVVWSLVFGHDGTLYAGGEFHDRQGGGCANCLHISQWDGANWTSLDIGVSAQVNGLVVGRDGNLFATGAFATAGGVDVNGIAMWNPTTGVWSALGIGLNAVGFTVAIDSRNHLYVGGLFTEAGLVNARYIAEWNGTSWSPLGVGVNHFAYGLSVGPDNMLYVGGAFSTAGGIALADKIAKWDGSAWTHLDIDFPGVTPVTRAVLASKYHDPVIKEKYDLLIGFITAGTTDFAGKVTVTNGGSEAYPKIIISISGYMNAALRTIRNETTGKELPFDYLLVDGETLTIDLTPAKRSIISSFFGPRPDAILSNSDIGEFTLQPGANVITCFIDPAGGTLVTYMVWRDTYKGFD